MSLPVAGQVAAGLGTGMPGMNIRLCRSSLNPSLPATWTLARFSGSVVQLGVRRRRRVSPQTPAAQALPHPWFGNQASVTTLAHDRRGHGRSGQPWNGNDPDTYADDLAALMETLDLRDAILVSHSTGGGEVTRYL
jgi:Serine aminopeptidase, S33